MVPGHDRQRLEKLCRYAGRSEDPQLRILVPLVLPLPPLVCLVLAWRYARLRGEVRVAGGVVRLTEIGPFSSRQVTIPTELVEAVSAYLHGDGEDTPLPVLTVEAEGRPYRCFSGRSLPELQWTAERLRQHLELGGPEEPRPRPGSA